MYKKYTLHTQQKFQKYKKLYNLELFMGKSIWLIVIPAYHIGSLVLISHTREYASAWSTIQSDEEIFILS